jgi:DNA-binding response OmpR family regulator
VEEGGGLRGKRVLVVDDEPYILKILVFKLRTAGLVPVEATDGASALRAADEEPPDAVLLDVSLSPGLSGFDVLERLRSGPRTRHVPVIVLTGRSRPDERATALRLGAARFLTKPFSTGALLAELEAVLAAPDGK